MPLIILMILLSLIFFVFHYYFSSKNICYSTNKYIVVNEKNEIINCYVYLNKRIKNKYYNEDVILFFYELDKKNRIHIDFYHKKFGTPEFGDMYHFYNNKKLELYNNSLFHNDGSLFSPYFNNIDLIYEFKENNILKFETIGEFKKLGKYIIIKKTN